jgi:phosphoribosyl-ATP pyrophosphohydrolase
MTDMISQLEAIIADRKANPRPSSYTNSLLDKGIQAVAQKVGEEAVEVVIAALSQTRERQIDELADLFYHTLVLMAHQNISLDDVRAVLQRRHQSTQE